MSDNVNKGRSEIGPYENFIKSDRIKENHKSFPVNLLYLFKTAEKHSFNGTAVIIMVSIEGKMLALIVQRGPSIF